jgi:hypothetical protein
MRSHCLHGQSFHVEHSWMRRLGLLNMLHSLRQIAAKSDDL